MSTRTFRIVMLILLAAIVWVGVTTTNPQGNQKYQPIETKIDCALVLDQSGQHCR